jgi:hypothetical protein
MIFSYCNRKKETGGGEKKKTPISNISLLGMFLVLKKFEWRFPRKKSKTLYM